MAVAVPALSTLDEARSALVAEWASARPGTPEQIHEFYVRSDRLADELAAWHATGPRRAWSEAIAYVARKIEAALAVDVGCGGGQDLRALRDAGVPRLVGVEPNRPLRTALAADGLTVVPDVTEAPIEAADLILCMDVLEHLPDPEAFLDRLASRARAGGERPGAVLVESTATSDLDTPLHLEVNRGWHPGRALERHGFELIEQQDRMRVWQRVRMRSSTRASLLLCAYRTVSVQTFHSALALGGIGSQLFDQDDAGPAQHFQTDGEPAWRVITKTGDGLVSRARSVIASRWWAETADEAFLMVDDDIVFDAADAAKIVRSAIETRGVVCAAYPVRSGAHLAIRGTGDGEGAIEFGPEQPRQEIEYASTGFMAVHRSVLDAMIPTLELCHGDQPWAFWPLFAPLVRPMGKALAYLSEDWAFCARARELGIKIYVEPSIRLGHLAQVEMDVNNMARLNAALVRQPSGTIA